LIRSTPGRACALLLALAAVGSWVWPTGPDAPAAQKILHASTAPSAGLWPLMVFESDEDTVAMGAPERLEIPVDGSQWVSPGPMEQSGFVVAWAQLKAGFAATAIGSVSADGSTWTEITRASANANRSMPFLNLVLPVPEGHHFRLQLEGARGGGLEIVEASGGHWFPLSVPKSDS
jgi:hypothetical protein